MPRMSGKFTTKPSPKIALNQIWKDKNGTHRKVVAPLDDWEVHFSRIPDGYRTKVARVSKGGVPSGGYQFVPPPSHDPLEVHIRFPVDGQAARTFCQRDAAELITTTLNNYSYWKRRVKNSKRLAFCGECLKRREDGVTARLGQEVAA